MKFQTYKWVLLLLNLIVSAGLLIVSRAEAVEVVVKPDCKIRAYSYVRQIGDEVPFYIKNDVYKNGNLHLKKNTPVTAQIVDLTNTRQGVEYGSIGLENFVTHDVKNNRVKLNGGVYKKCDGYDTWQCFIIFGNPVITKGDTFSLFVGD